MTSLRSPIPLVAVFAVACAGGPSARWQKGGDRLPLDAAYWSRSESTIELRPTGEVIEDQTVLFRVDRAGRLRDSEGKPVAVLGSDGNLVAEDDTVLGWIGAGSSFRADRKPSVRLSPSGDVSFTLKDGSWRSAGRSEYCAGAMLKTCTFVFHVIAARDRERAEADKARSGGGSLGDALKLLELLKLAK